jgi:hypothetical protein
VLDLGYISSRSENIRRAQEDANAYVHDVQDENTSRMGMRQDGRGRRTEDGDVLRKILLYILLEGYFYTKMIPMYAESALTPNSSLSLESINITEL